MRIGVIDEVDGAGDETRLARLVEAEAQGYAAVWLGVRAGVEVSAGRSLFALAGIAEGTRTARIGLRSPLPENLHPLRLAEDLAVLDIASGGRLDWAPTAGASPEELEIILRAWRGEPFAHTGPRYAFPELRCLPCPEQRPHPGLWLEPGSERPEAASPDRTGCLADPGVLGPEAGSRPLALICPISASGGAGPEDWRRDLEALRGRFDPDWILVWPEGGSGDEEQSAKTQRLFARELPGLSA
jgi:alkanesulfonate monooxygenase SsuD/methylene tetrahydromethanopterin reductase-like flavin-dependent oxidoreductase (luciferase family)